MRSFVLLAIASLSLSACNGVSGANGDDPFGNGGTGGTDTAKLQISLLDSSCKTHSGPSFNTGSQICIQARLSKNGNPASGEIITFSTQLGNLSVESKLTSTDGVAEVILSSTAGDVGASTLTASYGDISQPVNYEFLAGDGVSAGNSQLHISMLVNGQLNNRISSDTNALIQARLTNFNDQPIADQIVSFSTNRGNILATSALTNGNGIAQVTLVPSASDLGAGTITIQTANNDAQVSDSMNFEVVAPGTTSDQVVRFGYLDGNGIFTEGEIGTTPQNNVTLSAGGTLGLNVALVDEQDNPVTTPFQVSFSSGCSSQNQAKIDPVVVSKNGIAHATFEDISCAGSNGITDQISASVVINNETVTLHKAITIQPESIGSVAFIDAQPAKLVLQGTGGQNTASSSVITFQVNSDLGNPLAQQKVTFSLNTNVGGLSLSKAEGLTNSQGQVSTTVRAGTVPTAVRVTAIVTGENNTQIQSQSDLLTVSTGLPDQNSFSLAFSTVNPEAGNIDGTTVDITARLADSFNNPVPDGTAVSFTTEGGSIEPSCTTTNGTCTVVWTSQRPRVNNHRITVLATAIGHETLFDSNGNNSYDDADGSAITDNTDSGFGNSQYGQTGFVDYAEAWRDDDEDDVHDASEIFIDFDNSGSFTPGDGKFNGPQCTSSSNCGASSMNVRKAGVIIMASSDAHMDILAGSTVYFSNHQTANQPTLALSSGQTITLTLRYADTANQPMPSGTTASISTTLGTLSGVTEDTVPNTNTSGKGSRDMTFNLTHDGATGVATIETQVTSPSGVVSRVTFNIWLN
ncbi:Ig-like domain-containing protein [Neptunicella marina]|uniref:Ig-like domain-containing protein n=1 Tax=Neptunicella marina TaxID=2125989 RepID=A0A8J6IR81_9ALTE|nr:Ig-like domain-containing protein [Neptunicella marina]MBC3764849.1 Ig-like domain-containing protein [Neptunicella marina]